MNRVTVRMSVIRVQSHSRGDFHDEVDEALVMTGSFVEHSATTSENPGSQVTSTTTNVLGPSTTDLDGIGNFERRVEVVGAKMISHGYPRLPSFLRG